MIHCLVNWWFTDTNNLRCVFMSSCCVCCSSAPGWVAHLKLEALNEKTLRLSWSPPDGDWDFYRILLFNGSSVLMNRTIERNLVEFCFTNWTLIPGRLYRAAVSVESGYLSSTAGCHGRLGVLLINSTTAMKFATVKQKPTWSGLHKTRSACSSEKEVHLNCIAFALLLYFKVKKKLYLQIKLY